MSEAIPVPGWYAAMIGPPFVPLEDLVERRFPARVVRASGRIPVLRGALVWLATARAPLLGLVGRDTPGTRTLLLLETLLARRRRRIVVLQFIGREPSRLAARRLARRLLARLDGWAMRRSLAAAHVLTEAERERYATEFRLPAQRFRHIPWPLSRTGAPLPPPPPASRRVVCSGRAYCDWDTVLAAAAGRDWELTLICGEADHAELRVKAAGIATEVLCELSREEHDARLREATVYALVLRETAISAGHVRLTSAVDSGSPVVATDVPALDGYLDEGAAVLVPPADPEALGQAVDRLLGDESERLRLREAASERARRWTYDEYFAAIGALFADIGGGATDASARRPRSLR